jgi:hypothetical protein
MRPLEQREGQRPRGRDRERVAGELVGTADAQAERLADHDLDAHQEGGSDQQHAAEPDAGPGDPVGQAQQRVGTPR